MTMEFIDRRVLGAVRLVDATTGVQLREPLVVEAEGAIIRRNLGGLYVLHGVPGLEEHTEEWERPPAEPPLGDIRLRLTVRDPSRRYLDRRQTIRLPLNAIPTVAVNSLFTPIDVRLYPAPSASTEPGWAVVRASVRAAGTDAPLSGALIRVEREGQTAPLALGLSDERGEALVPVAGIPVTTWDAGEGPVIVSGLEVTLAVFYDPDGVEAPDPEDLETRRASLRPGVRVTRPDEPPVRLVSGQERVERFTVALP